MNLAPYAQRLVAAVKSGKKSEFDDLCFDLEYEQLLQEHWPQEVFAFVADALRDPVICRLSGARSFTLYLYNDFEKLTLRQRDLLLELFDVEADNFGDEVLRYSASDLIARKYDPYIALSVFCQWAEAKTVNRRHMALVGLEVLLMANRLDRSNCEKARSLLPKLSR